MPTSIVKVLESDDITAKSIRTNRINGIEYPVFKDAILSAIENNDPNYEIVNKFGSSLTITDEGFTVISHGGVYQTPLTAQSLEFSSDDIGDALNGLGGWEITIIGLDANWDQQTVVVACHATDGTVTVAIPGTWMRVFIGFISASGTYATLTDPSHIGKFTIRNVGGGVIWAEIITTDVSHSQTQIGAYTVKKGWTAYIGETDVHTETNKAISVFGFKREGANIVTAPFNTMRIFTEIIGVEGSEHIGNKSWLAGFPEYTDLGFLAKRTAIGSASCTVDFEILLIKNEAT